MIMSNREFGNDRRTKHRFAMQREVRFKVLENDRIVANGTGRTIDISSGGVAFEAPCVKAGALVELSISWPVLLAESCLMRLIVFGRVVRTGKRDAACTIDRYEFRTQGRVCKDPVQAAINGPLRRWAGTMERELRPEPARS